MSVRKEKHTESPNASHVQKKVDTVKQFCTMYMLYVCLPSRQTPTIPPPPPPTTRQRINQNSWQTVSLMRRWEGRGRGGGRGRGYPKKKYRICDIMMLRLHSPGAGSVEKKTRKSSLIEVQVTLDLFLYMSQLTLSPSVPAAPLSLSYCYPYLP